MPNRVSLVLAVGLAFCVPGGVDHALANGRATSIPTCALHVDAAAPPGGSGSSAEPLQKISGAVERAGAGAVICVAEGEYTEPILPGDKPFTLAGGFQHGAGFTVRDSAVYVSKAVGKGGSFLHIVDPGPSGDQLTAIDGFEITGYSQAIVRDHWESQRFDLTNNFIHDNVCADQSLAGAAFALVNVSGAIRGNVIRNNSCGRGGGGFLNDPANTNSVTIEENLVDGNAGSEPDGSHGGGFYFFGNRLRISDNVFVNNTVTQWGGGLYVGAYTPGNQPTTATLSRNVFRGNRAGNSGGGFFCDDGATCSISHDIYDRNCGGNVLLDGGPDPSGPTISTFDHITNVFALTPDCGAPGIGVLVGNYAVLAPDRHSFSNSIFWGNAGNGDFAAACGTRCDEISVKVETSMAQTSYADESVTINFAAGNIAPSDPLFNAQEAGDFGLRAGSPAAGMGAMNDGGSPGVEAAAQQADNFNPVASGTSRRAAKASVGEPAARRGAMYMGFQEKFNRYYTDPAWTPAAQLFVSPDGGGDGTARELPMEAGAALAAARPGTLIYFLRGAYSGGLELSKDLSGTYDNPIVLLAEPSEDGGLGVQMNCDAGARKSCFNLEGADNIAIEGFEFVGGAYGVRAVGLGFEASRHSHGIAVIGNTGHGQEKDPFFSGQSDWNVWEGNLAYGAKAGDGHGIYISNGSDWNIVRSNNIHSNASSGFQINADPNSTCGEEGIAFDDPLCDAYAGEGEGGRGASDYFLVENNYVHHNSVGPNFTSVRRSIIRNNIFGLQSRHNSSFWQETDNPKLGSSDNLILHNLFVATQKHGVQFANNSIRNTFANNVILGVQAAGGGVAADKDALLLGIGEDSSENSFVTNFYGSGRMEGRSRGDGELTHPDVSLDWFIKFPVEINDDVQGFQPSSASPYLNSGLPAGEAARDWNNVIRSGAVDLGPFEIP